jgi:hypothetical protein
MKGFEREFYREDQAQLVRLVTIDRTTHVNLVVVDHWGNRATASLTPEGAREIRDALNEVLGQPPEYAVTPYQVTQFSTADDYRYVVGRYVPDRRWEEYATLGAQENAQHLADLLNKEPTT